MRVPFTKMHGAGNDFVVFNTFEQPLQLNAEQVRHIADRHYGIGCDQVLVLEPADSADVLYRIYNADGSEVMQCGNGARCVAVYLQQKGLVSNDEIQAVTGNGLLILKLDKDGEPIVNMGTPGFEPEQIPARFERRQNSYSLSVGDNDYDVSVLSIGNPHAVLVVDDTEAIAVTEIGPQIQQLDDFPESVNVGFMQVLDKQAIRLRVYERGVGETLACGSGACAAVIAGCTRGLLEGTISVEVQGGMLTAWWDGEDQPVWLKGPAETIFDGIIDL